METDGGEEPPAKREEERLSPAAMSTESTEREEEGDLSPTSGKPKNTDVPSEPPPFPTSPTSARGPPSSQTLQPLPGAVYGSRVKRAKREQMPDPDPEDVVPLSASPTEESPSNAPSEDAQDTEDVPTSPMLPAYEEDEDPFGGGFFPLADEAFPPSTGPIPIEEKTKKRQEKHDRVQEKRKRKHDKAMRKEQAKLEQDQHVDEEWNLDSPPGVKLPQAWERPSDNLNGLHEYFKKVLSEEPDAKKLRCKETTY